MINSVTLVGRLTKDPDLRFTSTGKAVATFTLAVTRAFNREETDFINCQVWGKPAENTANFCKKGSLVGLTGRIQTRSYDHDTKGKQYITEIVADSVQFLDTKPKSSNHGEGENSRKETKTNDDPFKENSKTIDLNDDDLPF